MAFPGDFTAGPAKILKTMHLTEKGEWKEGADVMSAAIRGSTTPRIAAWRCCCNGGREL
jgi:hypothetical protein